MTTRSIEEAATTDHHRNVLHQMRHDAHRRSEDPAREGDDRVFDAARAAALGHATATEAGHEPPGDPVHLDTLERWLAALKAAQGTPNVIHHRPHAQALATRIGAIELALELLTYGRVLSDDGTD